MALNTTNADAILKEVYAAALSDLTYKNRPFLAMVPKGQWDGDTSVEAMVTENTVAGASNDFATAQSNKGNSQLDKFSVTLAEVHALGSISDVVIEVSKNRRGAFVSALKHEVDSGMSTMMNKLASQVWRDSSGAIGQVGSSTASAITLKDAEDVVNYGVNMLLETNANKTDTSPNTGSATITAVNRGTGVLTADTTGIGSIADDDFIFQDGDFGNALSGVQDWVPSSDPDSTAFFGLDRTSDLTRLSGVRVPASDVSGLPIEEKIQHLISRIGREGGEPDALFMNYANVRNLEISLGSKVQYVDEAVGNVGFRALTISSPVGQVKVFADRWCPSDSAYAVQLNTWKLLSTTGGMPALQQHDGNRILREGTANNYEFRIRFYGNLLCNAPGKNGQVDLS